MSFASLESRFNALASRLQSPVLLLVRLGWGLQLVQTGWGKLTHLARTADYFASLNIPLPAVNAAAAGTCEFAGGLLLAVGLRARLAAVPIVATMAVALATAERETVLKVFSEPTAVLEATPFPFLLAALIVLVFGPGSIALDTVVDRLKPAQPASTSRRESAPRPAAGP